VSRRFLANSATAIDVLDKGQTELLTDVDLRRISELVRQYADRRLGGTDASLVAVAERLAITTIATMNRRDFDNVRPRHAPAFTIVPT
jgi:uncharacterized protein